MTSMAFGCNGRNAVQCEQDSNCDLSGGGKCVASDTGQWCAYPDPACPAGYRYSDQRVGGGVSGECVPDDRPDGGLRDATPDSPSPRPDGSTAADMIMIPGGQFLRGCNQAQEDCSQRTNETPLASINISTFYMDTTEVTQLAYKQCMDAGQCSAPDSAGGFDPTNKATYPVGGVDWSQAVAYCTWKGKRLPTEAEWQKASRGTDGRTYPWGNIAPSCTLAHYLDCPLGNTQAIAVGSKAGDSPNGLKDMAGNIIEWTNDWYSNSYYQTSPTSDPQGPTSGMYKVLGGGGFGYGTAYLRSANRYFATPATKLAQFGFRCAKN